MCLSSPLCQALTPRGNLHPLTDYTFVKLQPWFLLQRRGVWYLWMGLWPSHCDIVDGIKPWVKKEGLEARLCHLPYVHVGRANRAIQVQIALGSPGSWVQLLIACHSPRLKTQSKINHEAVRDRPAGYSGPLLLRGWVSFLKVLGENFSLGIFTGWTYLGSWGATYQNPNLFLYLTVSPPQAQAPFDQFPIYSRTLTKNSLQANFKSFLPKVSLLVCDLCFRSSVT